MLTIGELCIQLPDEFKFRAENIASLTGKQLASNNIDKTLRIDTITLPAIQLDMQQTDESISVKIAEAILTELKRRL